MYGGQAPTRATVDALCDPQTTRLHHIPGSSAPFFGAHRDWAGHRLVFGLDVWLKPSFGNVGDSRKAGEWDLLEQLINEAFRACVDNLVLRVLDELATAVAAVVVLLAVVAAAVFDHVL